MDKITILIQARPADVVVLSGANQIVDRSP
jgi:hypothetical protein